MTDDQNLVNSKEEKQLQGKVEKSSESGVTPVFIKSPVVKVHVGGCEVKFVEPADREVEIKDALELLKRYGRLERVEFVNKYLEAVQTKDKKIFEMPLVIVTTNEEKADGQFYKYAMSGEARRLGVQAEGETMQLKPEVVHFEGLDASKPVDEASPAKYLVLPFQARMGDPLQGLFLPEPQFEQWCREIPGQSKEVNEEAIAN